MKNLILALTLILTFILSAPTLALAEAQSNDLIRLGIPKNNFLSQEQAFQLQTFVNPQGDISLSWILAPGYYLYQKQISLVLYSEQGEKEVNISDLQLPPTKIIHDPYFGEQPIYENTLEFILTLKDIAQGSTSLKVHYQGCSEQGLCYPPIDKSFNIHWQNNKILDITESKNTQPKTLGKENTTLNVVSPTPSETNTLFSASILKTLLTFLGLGALLSFTPCVLPMLPILSSVIIGQKKLNTKKAFLLSLSYTMSMALTLALLGVIAVFLGKNFQALFQQPLFISAFASIFIYLGLVQVGVVHFGLPSTFQNKISQWQMNFPAGSYLNAVVMGTLATLIASPCVSAPLVGALSFIAQTGNYWLGAGTLFCLGLGMGSVLMIAGTLGGHYLPKAGQWMHIVNKFFAAILFALSIWLISRLLNSQTALILWSLWCLLIAYWLGAFSRLKEIGARIGVLFMLMACVCLLSIKNNDNSPQQLLTNLWYGTTQNKVADLHFNTINSIEDLHQFLMAAQKHQSPTLVKAYANWCTTCKDNEKIIFASTIAQSKLQSWQLLMIDMTEMTAEKQALINHLNIYGPPAILFFDTDGKEAREERLVGKSSLAPFLARLSKIYT
ncbi:protein-disulfide reductase DsbD [Candidatus Berkiella cookevillensis]|uniref:Protein-disulfide reductase DsbD n=1 Tax=Candidatus Berkiella cookevillensis TaxID=437022 RepID=A0A0Q9YAM1_9GAMM|nr:protein-disulfide reductase DsbD [Candidatus Berkiella cookevillensis]MCS5709534.1 protein-disulfide reductase DsbD [Candidatus Berkiella cookevillensis]